MARRDAETAHPMNVEAALRAVGDEVLKLAFEVGFHLQQLEPQHLRVGDERIGPAVSDPDRLVDERIGLLGLVRDGVDGVLQDVALPVNHGGMLVLGSVAPQANLAMPRHYVVQLVNGPDNVVFPPPRRLENATANPCSVSSQKMGDSTPSTPKP